jgi:hypothetical protein
MRYDVVKYVDSSNIGVAIEQPGNYCITGRKKGCSPSLSRELHPQADPTLETGTVDIVS